MIQFQTTISHYLQFCQNQKCLDSKTIKAYRIDLNQFGSSLPDISAERITPQVLEAYLAQLHQTYKPRTAKRKIASLKAFFKWLEFRDLITANPFNKIQVKFREPVVLPKIIPIHSIEALLRTMYRQKQQKATVLQAKWILRDIAAVELLFATGIRISELCSLTTADLNLQDGNILIHGKGSKERRIQIGSSDVMSALCEYKDAYHTELENSGWFFMNRIHQRLSEQSVRNIIQKYASMANIEQHITPHMFRHSFATYLLEADVDIRCIQEMLGHSSIHITEIYTHVSTARQKDILSTRHPRIHFCCKDEM